MEIKRRDQNQPCSLSLSVLRLVSSTSRSYYYRVAGYPADIWQASEQPEAADKMPEEGQPVSCTSRSDGFYARLAIKSSIICINSVKAYRRDFA
jgi:hypothetical protein